ncbi:MAG: hypothetical protein ACT4QE_25360 [Anaerolineales bacterium]
MKPNHDEVGVGATEDLSLRVSVATLVRVLFEHPRDGELTLALERKVTLHETETGRVVEVKSQPFGGAIRIRDLMTLRDLIGDFHFDSERSRSEQDFRIFIRPSDWTAVRQFCIQHFSHVDDPILETDPGRELAEEFADALKINLKPDQYSYKPIATVVEDNPALTENIHAKGVLTTRVYRIFEAHISDSSLAHTVMAKSESLSHQDLCELALEDAQNGGKGRANTILALPMKLISDVYLAMSPKERNRPILFEKNRLDETVPVVLDGITVSKYQRL